MVDLRLPLSPFREILASAIRRRKTRLAPRGELVMESQVGAEH